MTGEPGTQTPPARGTFSASDVRSCAYSILGVAAVVAVLCPSTALAEAAIKAQEGNVRNWIEYYERERASRAERVQTPQRNALPETAAGAPATAGPAVEKKPAR